MRMMKQRPPEAYVEVTSYVPWERGTIGVLLRGRLLRRGSPHRMWFTTNIPTTVLGGRPVLRGWLGADNNYSKEALGVFVVQGYDAATQALFLRPATEREIRQWLEYKLPGRWAWVTEDLVSQALGTGGKPPAPRMGLGPDTGP